MLFIRLDEVEVTKKPEKIRGSLRKGEIDYRSLTKWRAVP
jgi:hypothetical protein